MYNKKKISLIAVLVVAVMMVASFGALAADVMPTGIYVTSQGEVDAQPDFATVSLGVNTTDRNAAKARNDNAELVKKVEAALIKAGVASKDIKNEYINMYPTYDYKDGGEKLTGYSVSNSLSVKIKDLDKLGDTVNAALAAGANNLNGVTFDVEDRDAYYAQAVKKAMSSARKKAASIAKESKLTLGAITSVNEAGFDNSYYGNQSFSMNAGMDTVDQAAGDTAVYDLGNTLKPSPVKISVSLSVSFAVK